MDGFIEDGQADIQGEQDKSYIKDAAEADIIFDKEGGVHYVKNQIIVSTHLGASKELMSNLAEELGADIVGYIELTEDYQLEFRAEMTYTELMEKIAYVKGFPFVRYAEVNLASPCEAQAESNDALYDFKLTPHLLITEWLDKNGKKLEDTEAWNSVVEYANDDGENDDLSFAKIYENPTTIYSVHGTHVAGIIGAKYNNGVGISGVATDVELYGYAVEDSAATVYYCLERLIKNRVRVINMSYGYDDGKVYSATVYKNGVAYNEIEREAKALSDKLQRLIERGYDFLIVASAGNGNGKVYVQDPKGKYEYSVYNDEIERHKQLTKVVGNPDPKYNYYVTAIEEPAVMNRIMVVGAVENLKGNKFQVASFSQEGDRVDTYAPGVTILSTVPKTGFKEEYMTMWGTSMAAPHISGLAALMLQANPNLTAAQIKRIIKKDENVGYQVGGSKYMPDAEKCVLEAMGH